jgi:predicted transposase/invertase (TIGR01784 family)
MLSNIHDSFFKSLFSIKDNLRDLLQGTLPEEILQQMDTKTLEYDPTEYVDQKLAPYFRDISCNMLYGEARIKISLLYEHKSYPDSNIHLQLLRYILNVWEHQRDNQLDLMPVLCIVFYHGRREWNQGELLANPPKEFIPFIPLFDFIMFDTKEMEDHAIINHFKRPSVKIGVWFLKHSDNLVDHIHNNPALAREIFKDLSKIEKTNIQRIAIYLNNVSGVAPEKIDQIMKSISPEAKDAFDEFRIKVFNEGIEQGIEQGFEQGIEQGIEKGKEESLKKIALNMILKGYKDKQISEVTQLSISRIQSLRMESSK